MTKIRRDPFVIDNAEYGAPIRPLVLEALGDQPEDTRLMMRRFDVGRVGLLLLSGTDRDGDSNSLALAGLEDSEVEAMGWEYPANFTFAETLTPTSALYARYSAIAIYKSKRLKPVQHRYPWNGLHRFKGHPKKALLGVVKGNPRHYRNDLLKNHPSSPQLGEYAIREIYDYK